MNARVSGVHGKAASRRKQLSKTLARPRLRAGGQTRKGLDIIGAALDAATSVSERTH